MTDDQATYLGPFGAATKIDSVSAAYLSARYRIQCEQDIEAHFNGISEIDLYRCESTGMLFWRPEAVAGSEAFYQQLDGERDYYRHWRWEYDLLARYLTPETRLLEIGCGEGYFLKSTEGRIRGAVGIELTRVAIANKVTAWPILNARIEEFARTSADPFDMVCSFQVLEHVTQPAAFIRGSLCCLKPGGRLVLSVPNHENVGFANREDALDLPPHHVNQFSPDSLRKIAAHFGLVVERLETQIRPFTLEPVTASASSFVYRAARFLARKSFGALYRWNGEPGHTMMVVLRYPA